MGGTVTRVALTGAAGGYGRTLLGQLLRLPDMRAAVLVDPSVGATLEVLADLGYPDGAARQTRSAEETREVVEAGGTAVVASGQHLDERSYDVLVEATGRPVQGYALARDAISRGRGVVMVSKEVDSVVGRHLSQLAREHGVGYLPGEGDQPANLLALLRRVGDLGLQIVAAGKSSEYDLLFDPVRGTASFADVTIGADGLQRLLHLGNDVEETVRARDADLDGLSRISSADYCEMAVVSLYSGLGSDGEQMHGPLLRPDELADAFCPRGDGGLLTQTSVVEVFTMLRLPGEASFAGGVFVVVRTTDGPTWSVLAAKGHVVSRDGRYACIYLPYHLMGIETPSTVRRVRAGAVAPTPPGGPLLAARVRVDLPSGTRLSVEGHHHEIAGCDPVFVPGDPAAEVCPFYLLDGAVTRRALPAGSLVSLADVDGVDDLLLAGHRAGRG